MARTPQVAPTPQHHITIPISPFQLIPHYSPFKAAEFFADPHNWIRIGEVILGIGLVGIGVFAAINGPKRVETVASVASKASAATPMGRAAAVSSKAKAAGKVAQHREAGKQIGRAQGKVAARKITASTA